MNIFKKIIKNNFFSINISFFIVLIICLFFQILNIFLYAFIFVFFHELTHILVAKKFGIKCEKIIITPIGQIAFLKDIQYLSKSKKLLIVSSGVILNFILAFIFSLFSSEKMQLFKNINLSIAFFNMLPIYPLDGGRFLQYYLSGKMGDLKANFLIKKISIFISSILFFLGFLQIIFLPYNISLLCLAIYFFKINKNQYIKFTFEFYKNLLHKNKVFNITKIKFLAVDINAKNKDIILNLSQEYIVFIYLFNNSIFLDKIFEIEFLNYIENNGLNNSILDAYNYIKNKRL